MAGTALPTPPPYTPGYSGVGDIPGNWYVLATVPSREFALARQLYRWGIPYFLPYDNLIVRYRNERKRIDRPTLPGYLFAAGDASRWRAMESKYAVQALAVPDSSQPKLREEIIHFAAAWQRGSLGVAKMLKPGARVRVISGPMFGQTGIIDRQCPDKSFVVLSEIFGRLTAVEDIDPSELEPEPAYS